MKKLLLRALLALMALSSYQGVFAQEAEKLTEELMWAYCVRVNYIGEIKRP